MKKSWLFFLIMICYSHLFLITLIYSYKFFSTGVRVTTTNFISHPNYTLSMQPSLSCPISPESIGTLGSSNTADSRSSMVISNLKINSNLKHLLGKREKDDGKNKYGEIEEKAGLAIEKRHKREMKRGIDRKAKVGIDRENNLRRSNEDSSSINEDGTVKSDTSQVRK